MCVNILVFSPCKTKTLAIIEATNLRFLSFFFLHTCFVKVAFKAPFQAFHQFGNATSVFFNNVDFGIQLPVLSLCDIILQGPEWMWIVLGEGTN